MTGVVSEYLCDYCGKDAIYTEHIWMSKQWCDDCTETVAWEIYEEVVEEI